MLRLSRNSNIATLEILPSMLVRARGYVTAIAVTIGVLAFTAMHAGQPSSRAARARFLMGTVCEGIAFPSPGTSVQEATAALEEAFDEIARAPAG